jgi:GntR family transcriptional regulator
MVHLDYRDARPIYAQIIDGFREQIATGILQPGDKLPSVRELAQNLAINPNTIQRSYRQLEMEGWIVTVPGKGCFVCTVPSIRQQEKQRLMEIFDSTVAALSHLGVSREELLQHLRKEETENA